MAVITTCDKSFALRENETLLEALERTGHEVEYQCREGYCGSCRIKLVHGSVHYPQFPLAFVGSDECLPCCCSTVEDVTVEAYARQDDFFGEREGLLPDYFE